MNKDAPKTIELTEGDVTITIQRQDPYGLLYLTSNKGDLPKAYQGHYTDVDYAITATKQYFESLQRDSSFEELKKESDGKASSSSNRK